MKRSSSLAGCIKREEHPCEYMVGAARVLDTGALLHLPPNRLSGGLVANSQRNEIARVDKDRALLIEGVRLHWRSPSDEALQRAREAAQETGDISGLSDVDMDVLAIALEHRAIIVTDDHRIQNVAGRFGVGWHPVMNEGIKEHWEWVLECKGCKKLHPPPENVSRWRRTYGSCADCGSKLKLKRGGT